METTEIGTIETFKTNNRSRSRSYNRNNRSRSRSYNRNQRINSHKPDLSKKKIPRTPRKRMTKEEITK